MKKKIFGFILTASVLCMVIAAVVASSVENKQLQEQINALQEEIDQLHRNIATANTSRTRQVEELSNKLEDLETLTLHYILPKVEKNSAFVDNYKFK